MHTMFQLFWFYTNDKLILLWDQRKNLRDFHFMHII